MISANCRGAGLRLTVKEKKCKAMLQIYFGEYNTKIHITVCLLIKPPQGGVANMRANFTEAVIFSHRERKYSHECVSYVFIMLVEVLSVEGYVLNVK